MNDNENEPQESFGLMLLCAILGGAAVGLTVYGLYGVLEWLFISVLNWK